MLRIALLVTLTVQLAESFLIGVQPCSNSKANFVRTLSHRSHHGVSSLKCSTEDVGLNRRQAISNLLLQLVAIPSLKPAHADSYRIRAPEGRPRNIIITGANSGIGRDAAAKLVAAGFNIILACRTLEKSRGTEASILAELKKLQETATATTVGRLIPMECDLASLASVRRFAAEFKALGLPLDVLALNAGVALSTSLQPPPPRTADGFELTVGTNHLGHFLLACLLTPLLERSGPGARLVVTASQVHDPASPGGNVGSKATLGDLRGLEAAAAGDRAGWEMVDGGPFDGDKAYKDSKLCNVLFAREAQRRLVARGGRAECTSFSPGLITESGLFRNQPGLFVAAFGLIANRVARVGESVPFGGDCLARMAAGTETAGRGGAFYSNSRPGQHTFEEVPVSAEASDAAKARRLWELSARAVGLDPAEALPEPSAAAVAPTPATA